MTFQAAFSTNLLFGFSRPETEHAKHAKTGVKPHGFCWKAATLRRSETGTRQRRKHADEPLTTNSDIASRWLPP